MLILYKVFFLDPGHLARYHVGFDRAVTITVGNLFAIRQKNLKRFLAFSSISQAGYIMLGIIAGSAQGMAALVVLCAGVHILQLGCIRCDIVC